VRLKGRENRLTDWANVERFCAEGQREIRAREARRGRYLSVYSRSMMPASHVLAALYKASHPKTPWTAEFSDPLLVDTRGERRTAPAEGDAADTLRDELDRRGFAAPGVGEMFELVEAAVYAMADTIIFTNELQRDLMLDHVASPELRERARRIAVVSPHPQPDPELYFAAPVEAGFFPDVVNVGYFGVFFGIRSIASLVSPLAALDESERARVRLYLYVPKPVPVRRQVAELGLDDCVEVAGFVPYLEFLNLATQFDWLVVADSAATEHHGVNPYLPSKLSDYLGSGTPVWAMVEAGSPMSRWPGITTTPVGDVEAATEQLRQMIAKKGTTASESQQGPTG